MMAIPAAYAGRYVYHTTHLSNLEGVLRHGILSYNEQLRRDLQHHSIAAEGIQDRRSRMQVTAGPGGVVHDYVPLYFTKRSPMLLKVVGAKNVDQMLLLHFAFPMSLLDRADVVFTNAAANSALPPRFFSDPADLPQLLWQAIDLTTWHSKLRGVDVKQKRMAEALVHTRLDPSLAAFIVVWNDWVEEKVKEVYSSVCVSPPRLLSGEPSEDHSFVNFRRELPEDMRQHSIACGPWESRGRFEGVVESAAAVSVRPRPRFPSIVDLLRALRVTGLGVLPETAELVGLESENDVHQQDVGTHTQMVVEQLKASPRLAELSPDDRNLVELAAYLHDIGKGPKSRWRACGGKQQVDADHPIRSAEMLPRILLEEVHLNPEATRTLCKLVCYHDLVGDIIGRDRQPRQLVDVAESEHDLDLLIVLGEADMASVVPEWGVTAGQQIPQLRQWVLDELARARTLGQG